MEVLRERGIPLAIHADLGNDEEPARYLPLIQEMLRLYPENTIVWMHMKLPHFCGQFTAFESSHI